MDQAWELGCSSPRSRSRQEEYLLNQSVMLLRMQTEVRNNMASSQLAVLVSAAKIRQRTLRHITMILPSHRTELHDEPSE